MRGRVSFWPRGRVLGGSSAINALLYVRGGPANYDAWAAAGCEGWDAASVLPHFKRSERALSSDADPRWHGLEGELEVSDVAARGGMHPVTARFVDAVGEAGVPRTSDYNGADQYGVREAAVTVTREGVRCSTAEAFLFANGATKRPNLTVLTGAHCTGVWTRGGRAAGVTYIPRARAHSAGGQSCGAAGAESLARARREVVLCAGAVCTPWLLMLSGIGPRRHLEEHGIPAVADLPVGDNMQDHLFIVQQFEAPRSLTRRVRPSTVSALAQYLAFKAGPAAVGALQAVAFADSGVARPRSESEHWRAEAAAGRASAPIIRGGQEGAGTAECDASVSVPGTAEARAAGIPDLQLHFCPALANLPKVIEDFNLTGAGSCFDASRLPTYGVTILPTLLRPLSRGTVRLRSADPMQHPAIDPGYLSHPYDVEVLVQGMRFVRDVAKQPALRGHIGRELYDETIPFPPTSDAYLREFVRKSASTVYHPVGTARMGAANDPRSVVDQRLRVLGVPGLRVADASIMPTIVSANTNAAVIMIGEKAAAMILEDWRTGDGCTGWPRGSSE